MIRPRDNSPYHSYRLVFDDLRSGRLSTAEYYTMVDEDYHEAERRRDFILSRDGLPVRNEESKAR